MEQHQPTIEQLAAFAAGELSDAEACSVRTTLESSSTLRQTEQLLRQIIATMKSDDSVAASSFVIERAVSIFTARSGAEAQAPSHPSLMESVRQVVARLVFDSRAQPALAGFRGASAACQLSYETEDGDIDLQMTRAHNADLWRFNGQVSLTDGPSSGRVTAVAGKTGRQAESTDIDEHGRFRLDVPSGTYQLQVLMNDRVILLPEINTG